MQFVRFVSRAGFLRLVASYVLALSMPSAIFAQKIKGVPWKGAPGVTESVATIMAREKKAGPVRPSSDDPKKSGRRPDPEKDAPGVPTDSQGPPPGSSSGGTGKHLQDGPGALAASAIDQSFTSALSQTVSTSFLGVTYLTDSGKVPPNATGAVGPSQIFVVVNGRARTFTKAGVQDGAIDVSTDTFFASVIGSFSTSDTRVIYDRLAQRWFVTMITVGGSPNRILIAVSSGPTITSTSSFTFFYFVQDQPGGSPNVDTGNFADYPSSGVDNFALYIGVNIFDSTATTYKNSSVFVVNKASLLTGSPPTPTITPFRNVASFTAGGDGPFSPQGVTNMDPNATEGYFVGPDTVVFGNLRFLRVSDPGGIPSITPLNLTVSSYRTPLGVPAQGSTQPLDGMDDRLGNAQMVVKPDGTKTLWITHATRVNSSGSGCSLSFCNRDGARFYEIGNMTTTPTVVQFGTLFDSASTNPNFFWVPSIATSGQGHTILASSYGGAANFAGIAITGRLAGDTLGTLNSAPTLIPSSASYNVQTTNPQRWGDLTSTVVDPADNMTMWTFQEFTNATDSWGVKGIQLLAPPPATLSSVAPSTVVAGTTVSITLTGTSSNGSGFYDPGAGFPNHLSATVSGTGSDVTVNSVTYTDPTHITLNLTIASNATANGRTITVTNPDGQSVTSAANFLTVVPSAQITLTPATLPVATVGLAYIQTITASGGTAPYTFSISAGALPGGMTLISSATTSSIIGTPTTSGTANFTVQAQDSLSRVGSVAYNLSVQSLLTSTITLPLVSQAYDATPVPSYNAGKFTLNTTLTNNGATIKATSRLYFKVSLLHKLFGDSSKPNGMLTADNGNGTVGDIQTVSLGGVDLTNGKSIPVSFTFGIGTPNTFSVVLDLYMVAAGSAVTALDTAADTPQATETFLGRFALTGLDAVNPAGSSTSSLVPSGSFSNLSVIRGPGAQSRPAVAVDPILPNRIAIASNDYPARRVRISTSQDGGATWNSTTLDAIAGGETFFVAQSPSLAFDSLGRLSVVYSVANLEDAANAIVISESTDLVNFNPPTAITFHPASEQITDSRPVIAINSNVGRIVAWDRLSQNTSLYSIMATRSAEAGPFDQQPVTVVGNALAGSTTLALSGNTVYLGWDEWGFNSTGPSTAGGRLMMAVSSSDTHNENPDPNNSHNAYRRDHQDREVQNALSPRQLRFDTPREIWRTAIGFGQRLSAMPDAGVGPDLALAADPTNEANVYAVFADRETGIDIVFGHSENGGQTWGFAKVNNDTGVADHFSPSIAVDAGGNVKIAFYDTRFSSSSETAHVFLARRPANGNSFDNQRVTTALINDSKTNPLRDTTANLGDRTAMTMMNGDVLVAWTDTRTGSEDIFASRVFDPVGYSISGTGAINFAAGSYVPNTSVEGTAEFGFDAGYRKDSSVPDGSIQFRFQTGKTKLKFRSTSFESLVVSGDTAELRGSGKVNRADGYTFVLTVSDGQVSGTNIDMFRLKITDQATGAVIFDNVSGAPGVMNDTVLQPIAGGRIEIRNQ